MTDEQVGPVPPPPPEPAGAPTGGAADGGQSRQTARRRNRRRRRKPAEVAKTEGGGVESAIATKPAKKRPAKTQPAAKRKPAGRGRSAIRTGSRTRQPSEFGTTWWARRWLAALERFGWLARLERGRDYARRGNVLDLDITPGRILAQVQGSRPWPYQVDIRLEPLTDEQWERVIRRLGRQAIYAAKLLAGDMPQNIEDIFNAADIALIPRKADAFTMSCTCPDTVTPCKHIAAVHYILGQEFDRDPFVLFELRGRTRQDIVHALQGRSETETGTGLPLVPAVVADEVQSLENFWKSTVALDEFPVHISPAPVPGGLLKRLGPLPLRGQSDEWRTQLFDVYRLVSRRAFALGRGDDRERATPVNEGTEQPEGQ